MFALINMVAVFMMSAKLAILGLLRINLFCQKGYDFIISVHDISSKVLSRDSDCIVDVVI